MESTAQKQSIRSILWHLSGLSLTATGMIVLLCFAAQHIAGWYFKPPVTRVGAPNHDGICFVLNDATTGVRGVPNCQYENMSREFGDVHYRFDANGYRNPVAMDQLDPRAFRIVMTGSSIAFGDFVSEGNSLAALLPRQLTRETGRPVELYNEGLPFGFADSIALRYGDVLATMPDIVLWILTPYDVKYAPQVMLPHLKPMSASLIKDKILRCLKHEPGSTTCAQSAAGYVETTRAGYALRYLANESQTEFVKSYLDGPDDEQGFLKADPSNLWRENLLHVDRDAKQIEEQTLARGIPLVAVYLPNRAQADMIATGVWPSGYDPFWLDRRLRSIVTSHGGTYLDILPSMEGAASADRDFLPVDGHPNAQGHALFARLIAQQLTSGIIPALRTQQPVGKEQ